jgi:cytochrome c biogenesis factor
MTVDMKRRVTIGVVILVVGIVLVSAGAIGEISSLTVYKSFTQPHPGEYVSTEIMLNTTSYLAVKSPATSGGIVPAQDLNLVNSTNINTYAVPTSTSGAGSDIYESLSGDYYYVAFSSAQPNTTIVSTPPYVVAFLPLILLGIVLAIAGIVIAVVGRREKQRPKDAGQT